jgi:multiple antibiotic resistance protein
MSFLTLTLILFLIMDPVGNISSFLSLMKGVEKRKQLKILTREMLIALTAMLLFNFIGEGIFNVLKISEITVKLSSGLILFLVALQILFPTLNSIRQKLPKGEPFIIPLAIPLIAGPSLLATILLFSRAEESLLVMLGAIITAWLAAFVVLLCSHLLYRLLGSNGLVACEKLMGMILVLLAIQRFLDGVKQFIETGGAA